MQRPLQRFVTLIFSAFALVALTVGYWSMVEQSTLVNRADNPRRLLLERRYPRGAIVDRNGVVLAESSGGPGQLIRHYPYPGLAPILGYVSPAYGVAGVEAALDGVLHGDADYSTDELEWSNLLGLPPSGRAVRLTLDARVQGLADEALGARSGAVVVMDSETGDLLALASHPYYDPNQLEDNWNTLVTDASAPLLNRATATLYQPGGVLAPLVLSAALRANQTTLGSLNPDATATFGVGAWTLSCITPPAASTLPVLEAVQYGCPWPLAQLGSQLERATIAQAFNDFRLFTAPSLGASFLSTAAQSPTNLDPTFEAIGQGQVTLTPLHSALITAALIQRGVMPAPRLILETESRAGDWVYFPLTAQPIASISPEAADALLPLLREGYTARALINAQGQSLAWFTGIAPTNQPRWVIAVLLEDGNTTAATQIGQSLVQEVSKLLGETGN